MPADPMTYWRATFTARATLDLPKVTKVYVIALPHVDAAKADALATPEVSRIFHRQTGRSVPKPLGGFVQVTHPERLHDLLSESGHPVWLERWMGKR